MYIAAAAMYIVRQPQPAAVGRRSSQKIGANRALLCDPDKNKISNVQFSRLPHAVCRYPSTSHWLKGNQGQTVIFFVKLIISLVHIFLAVLGEHLF